MTGLEPPALCEPAAHKIDAEAEDSSRYCPRCSERLELRSCKLICPSCSYYMSCSDYY